MSAKRKPLQNSEGVFYYFDYFLSQSELVEDFIILITLRQAQCDNLSVLRFY